MTRIIMLAAALAVLAASQASAQCRCTSQLQAHLRGSNSDRARQTGAAAENRQEQTERIIAAIRAGAGQTSAYIQRQGALIEKVSDASDLNQAIGRREDMRAGAEGGRYDPAVSNCLGYGSAAVMARGPTEAGPGEPPLPPTGADTQNEARNYARCAGGNSEVCEGTGAVVNGIIDDRDQLRNVGGVFDPTSDLRVLLQQPTAGAGTGADPDELGEAIWRLHQNIVDPVPAPPVTRAEAELPAGRAEIARRQSESARRSAAATLLGWIQTRSAAHLPLGDWARRTAPDGYPYPIDDRISVRQYYDVAVAASWRDPDWQAALPGMAPEAVMREVAAQLALGNDLALLQFELDLHRAAVDAVIASALLDQE